MGTVVSVLALHSACLEPKWLSIVVAACASNSMGSASSNLTDRDDHIKPEWSIRISYTPLEWLAENPNRMLGGQQPKLKLIIFKPLSGTAVILKKK